MRGGGRQAAGRQVRAVLHLIPQVLLMGDPLVQEPPSPPTFLCAAMASWAHFSSVLRGVISRSGM